MATATRARMNPRFSVHSDRLVRAVALSAGFVTANGRGASKLPPDYAATLSGVILPAQDWRYQVGVSIEQPHHELAGIPGVWALEVRPSVKSGAPRFFREFYPIAEWHRRTVAAIAEHFNIPFDVEWLHHATIQGRVFWPKTGAVRLARIHAEDARFLATLPGFRWIEHGTEIKIGIDHDEPR